MKKTLSIILAVLMIVSCVPIFASAAIRLNMDNIEFIPPTLSSYEIEFGSTFTDITLTGGTMYYIDANGDKTPVAGSFQFARSEKGPSVPTKNYEPILRFVSSDTSAYSSITSMYAINYSECIAEGYSWPAVTVKGKEAVIETMPSVSDSPIKGNVQSYSVITGGKVIDENGVDVTAEGTWSFAKSYYLSESAYVDIQWEADGYYTVTAPIWVNVYANKAYIKEAPAATSVTGGNYLYTSTLSGGLVEDENGNDITSNGYWAFSNSMVYPAESGEYPVYWTAIGYEELTGTAYVSVDAIKVSLSEKPALTTYGGGAVSSRGTFSGGKIVLDSDGTDVTSLGKWSCAEAYNFILTEAGEVKIRWIASGYTPIETTVIAEVILTGTTLEKAPTIAPVVKGTTMKKAANLLSGARVKNDLNTVDIEMDYWTVEYPDGYSDDTELNENITVTAHYNRPGYVPLSCQVVIEVTEAPAAVITEFPTIKETVLTIGMTAGDLTLEGGAADVEGTFGVTDPDQVLVAGSNQIGITFTPASYERDKASGTIRASFGIMIAFVNDSGEEIVPEISTIHNAVFGETTSIDDSLYSYLPCKQNSFEYFDAEGNSLMGTMVPLGRNEITVKVTSKDTNYIENTLKFILTVEPKEFTVTPSYNFANGRIKVIIDNKLDIPGEYDVYVNGELIGTTENKEVKWKTENSCTVDLELVHKDESGRYVLTNGKQVFNIRIPRYLITVEGSLSYSTSVEGKTGFIYNVYMDDIVTLECTDPEFYAWSLTLGGEKYIPEGLTEEDLKNPVITFTMPDSDMGVSADTKGAFAAGAECSHLCHSENKVLQLFWKLINFFCQLFDIQQYCDCGITHYDAPFFG